MSLTLKITVFCNLVFFKPCKYSYSLGSFTACECLLSSIILDTQPLTLINGNSVSGMTWELPKKFYVKCVFAFHGAFPQSPSPPRAESPSPSRRPAAAPIHPSREEEFIEASKGGSSAPSTVSTGPSLPVATTSPKTEIKKKRKRKSVKCTVTSKTVSPPEKRKKIISEFPGSQAEGPFRDSDTVSAPEDSSHTL